MTLHFSWVLRKGIVRRRHALGKEAGDCAATARRKWIAEKDSLRWKKSDCLTYCNHDGLFADFHSNRHTVVTNLRRAII